MQYKKNIDVNPFNSISSILVLVLVFVGLYFIAKGIFSILTLLAPVLLIGALILDYRVVVNYGKWLVNLLKSNPLMGIGAILLTVFGFPVIAGFLCIKAYLYRKVNKIQKDVEEKRQGEYVDFEEVPDQEAPFTTLELPQMEEPPKERPRQQQGNDYEQFFD
ncbi:MAG: hypothetical protein AAFP19_19865 [Bacteroidota bacterium]